MAEACFRCILTVAESKRLIAKGVKAMPCVRAALRSGLVVVTTGSTNSYLVEELTGKAINKTLYLSGRTQPQGEGRSEALPSRSQPALVLRDGQPVDGLSTEDAAQQLRAGDVVIKGANALDYRNRVAGVLVGHPDGGTVGTMLGPVLSRKCHYVVPVGLEKELGADIWEASAAITRLGGAASATQVPALWPVRGEIVTEIEALDYLAGVSATPIGSGGIDGAEGCVWLLISGEAGKVAKAEELVRAIQGEPAFAQAPRP
jgi:hypothetical protein